MKGLILKRDVDLTAAHRAFPYQLEAFEAVKDLECAAIFHEQGLGKTKIAIDLLLYWLSEQIVDSVLLVTKGGLVANWQREFRTHTKIRPRILTQDRKANFAALNSPVRVYLCHYEVIKSEEKRLSLFLKTRRVGIILDESQKFKNPDSGISKSLFRLSELFTKKVIMTGTPLANRPYDIWSQIYFLDRGASLGSDFEKFKADFDITSDISVNSEKRAAFERNLSGLSKRISDFAVRKTKAGANISLPRKEFHQIIAEWETAQEEIYRSIRDQMRVIVVREGLPTEENAEALLKRLLRLVQIAANPRLIDESYNGIPGKLEALIELLEPVMRDNEKAIVWTSFTENADWLAKEFRGYGTAKLHGKMAMSDRNRAVELFMADPKRRVLIATPGAAKEGLTLTVANHVIFYDRSFSLDDYLQAQDRIHRISQERTCHVYNLIMRDSVDEWVDVLLRIKELAARFGQGDIQEDEYLAAADYTFSDVLNKVLAIEADH